MVNYRITENDRISREKRMVGINKLKWSDPEEKVKLSRRSIVDILGKKFGRLTVIEKVNKNKQGLILWKCICECGKEAIVSGTSLRTGNTKSCGCLLYNKITTEEIRNKKINGKIEHDKEVLEEMKLFRAKGFRCVSVNKSPIPDFIAIKDGKPFAVEVQFGFPNIDKYASNDAQLEYADIIWIKKNRIRKKKSINY